jgi:hypothetical protein
MYIGHVQCLVKSIFTCKIEFVNPKVNIIATSLILKLKKNLQVSNLILQIRLFFIVDTQRIK